MVHRTSYPEIYTTHHSLGLPLILFLNGQIYFQSVLRLHDLRESKVNVSLQQSTKGHIVSYFVQLFIPFGR